MFKSFMPGAVGISLPLEDCARLARRFGFEGMDLSIKSAEDAELVSRVLETNSLRPGACGLPVRYKGGEEEFLEDLGKLDGIARAASAMGATRFATWVTPHSDETPFDEHFRFLASRFGECAKVLARAGCSLGLEFIGPASSRNGHRHEFIHTLGGMMELSRDVGENCGVLLDAWHLYASGGTVDELESLRAKDVVWVHVNDAPAGVPVDELIDNVRKLPGETGVVDVVGFLRALRGIGYDGPVTVEPFSKEVNSLPPEEAARVTAEALDRVWREALG